MAAIWKADGKWRAQVRLRDGRRKSGRFETRKEARAWAAQIEADTKHTATALGAHTLGAAFKRFSEEVTPQRKGARWERVRLDQLQRNPIASIQCAQLVPADIAAWRDERLKEVGPASVNRELNVITAVIEQARKEWGWITVNPCRGVSRPKNPRHRDRRISTDEIERVLIALGYDEDEPVETAQQQIAVAFLIALETAMRLGEIITLEWCDVHLAQRYVRLNDSKNSDPRDVALSRRAVELFERLPADRGRVFTCSRDTASTLFRRAVRAAQIGNLTFHDTRHEAITRLARKLDVLDLARMIGHRDLRSLRVYYNATATEIAGRLD